MKIAVCIKQVPAVSALAFDAATKTIQREGVRNEVSAFDLRALLKALELRAQHGGEVVAVTMGPPAASEALAECLALGADRAVHLCDRAFAGADTLATARALAAALRREAVDLVLCGRNSVDAETGQVGPELAELLDWPQVTIARTLSLDPTARTLTAERETDAGIDVVTAPLPALVTAAEDLAPERFTTRAERAAAQAKPIATLSAADLRLDVATLGAAGSPTWVLDLEGVEAHRRREMIEAATPEAQVDALVERLLGHGLFGTWTVERPAPPPLPEARDVPRAGSRDVLVVVETHAGAPRPVTFELLAKAVHLAAALRGQVTALVAGAGAARHAGALAAHGAARVIAAEDDAFLAGSESAAALLADVISAERPGLVVLPATVWGRDVAPRVAARLGLGLTGECVDLTLDAAGRVLQHKPAFGGSVVALIASRTQPEMATVRAGMLAAGTPDPTRRAAVVGWSGTPVADRVRVLSRSEAAAAAAELEEAVHVVGVGKGIGGAERLPVVHALAAALDGALCATRDVTDAGWLPKQYQVGVTGRAIAPQLYIAVALRGAFEHTAGVRRSGLIVAINRSAKAPIFKAADYGLVGDWAVLVPLLTARLLAARARIERRSAAGADKIAFLFPAFPNLHQTFVLWEVVALRARGVPIALYSIKRPLTDTQQPEGAALQREVHYLPPTLSPAVLGANLAELARRPLRYFAAVAGLVRGWWADRHAGRAWQRAELGADAPEREQTWREYARGRFNRSPFLYLLKSLWLVPRAVYLGRHLRAQGIHRVHAHWASYSTTMALVVHWLFDIPFSFTAHAYDIYLVPRLLAVKLREAEFAVTCARVNAEFLGALGGPSTAARIIVNYHGVDLDRFPPRPEPPSAAVPTIVTCGRLEPYKGHHILLRACARLARPVRLVVVGEGPQRQRLERLASELGIAARVEFTGPIPQRRLAEIYAGADVFVLASLILERSGKRDVIPNVLGEAMAMRLPVVATTVSGIRELVEDGVSGRLVAPNDPAALAAAIDALLADPAARQRLAEQGLATVRRMFDRDVNIGALAALFLGGAPAATRERA